MESHHIARVSRLRDAQLSLDLTISRSNTTSTIRVTCQKFYVQVNDNVKRTTRGKPIACGVRARAQHKKKCIFVTRGAPLRRIVKLHHRGYVHTFSTSHTTQGCLWSVYTTRIIKCDRSLVLSPSRSLALSIPRSLDLSISRSLNLTISLDLSISRSLNLSISRSQNRKHSLRQNTLSGKTLSHVYFALSVDD